MGIKEILAAQADKQAEELKLIIATSPKEQFDFPKLSNIYQPESEEIPLEKIAELLMTRYYRDAPPEVDSMEKFAIYLRESERASTT